MSKKKAPTNNVKSKETWAAVVPSEMEEVAKICEVCDREFRISVEHQVKCQALGWTLPCRCVQCNSKKRKVTELKCKNCNHTFLFSDLQKAILMKKYGANYREPDFCSECRNAWKEHRNHHNIDYR